jgi:hypothetical protein
MAEACRRKLLDRVAADHMLICGSHFPGLDLPNNEGRRQLRVHNLTNRVVAVQRS